MISLIIYIISTWIFMIGYFISDKEVEWKHDKLPIIVFTFFGPLIFPLILGLSTGAMKSIKDDQEYVKSNIYQINQKANLNPIESDPNNTNQNLTKKLKRMSFKLK